MELWQLKQRQSLPLEAKVAMAEVKIREWVDRWGRSGVYVSFSGGKDSTVLLHLVRSIYPEVPAVFCDTGLEYPEIRDFVRETENVVWLKPRMKFREVLEKYGYPVISKNTAKGIHEYRQSHTPRRRAILLDHKHPAGIPLKWQRLLDAPFKISHRCCQYMKKQPFRTYEKETGRTPILGTMAGESRLRTQSYLERGCNAFDVGRPISCPLSVWNEEDIWGYMDSRDVPYCPIYNTGVDRTGCVFCAFGVHMETGENRFQRLRKSHPELWRYCMDKLGMREVLEFIGVKTGDEEN